jgi:hypothetical protein
MIVAVRGSNLWCRLGEKGAWAGAARGGGRTCARMFEELASHEYICSER